MASREYLSFGVDVRDRDYNTFDQVVESACQRIRIDYDGAGLFVPEQRRDYFITATPEELEQMKNAVREAGERIVD